MSDRREREARGTCAAYLHEMPADWRGIGLLHSALRWDITYGPQPPDEFRDATDGLAHDFVSGCKRLSELIEPLPVELWYDFDAGCVTETDPYQDDSNWGIPAFVADLPDDGEREYIGPDDLMTVPTIEALFDKELWRYLT
jgi:hypothetical protein